MNSMLQRLRSKLGKIPKYDAKNSPTFVDERFISLLANTIFDWQIVNGMMLKYRDGDTVKARPVSVSLLPTAFPRHLFEQAQRLQTVYNELYAKVSTAEDWLFCILKEAAEEDEFIRALMEIHIKVKEEGFAQDITLGIFRSDYMLNQEPHSGEESTLIIKQVEFNTISVAGVCHATNAAEMHAHLARSGAFHSHDPTISPSSLPPNSTIISLVSALASAHTAYGPPQSPLAKETAILIIVQPFNYNIADERPLEYALWNLNPPIPTHRCVLQSEVLANTSLTPTRELLYHPPSRAGLPPLEISTIYLRAGHSASEIVNNAQGLRARIHLEHSRAIKCPSILGQLAGLKIVQMALSAPGALERFYSDDETRAHIAASFGNMYPLDDTERGKRGQAIALDPQRVVRYVLKPCREGGGHNVYRSAIPEFLRNVPRKKWCAWTLMELFDPPRVEGRLMTGSGIYEGSVVSELGVFGTCLWREDGTVVEQSNQSKTRDSDSHSSNRLAGWSFKTKAAGVHEMSVVKGYGCFDCPRLVDADG